MTDAIKVLLQRQSGFLQLESILVGILSLDFRYHDVSKVLRSVDIIKSLVLILSRVQIWGGVGNRQLLCFIKV
jgi:hypothetical protein